MGERLWRRVQRLGLLVGAGLAAFGGALLGSRRAARVDRGTVEDEEPDGTGSEEQGDERVRDRREDETGGGGESDQPSSGRNAAEWTTLAVSLAITGALVGAAIYEHLARDEPPGTWVSVELAIDQAERRGELYYVPFTVANDGAEPAANVTVTFEVKQGEEVLEESTADIAFLPNSGSEEGELVTALDPAAHEIEARVGSLQLP